MSASLPVITGEMAPGPSQLMLALADFPGQIAARGGRSKQLRPGLPDALPGQEDRPHEILMKGFEVEAEEPFQDNDGTERKRIRTNWWKNNDDAVIWDRVQVFGHYWNMPPVELDFAPPYPAGHPALRQWQKRILKKKPRLEEDIPLCGHIDLQGDAACIDFQGVTQSSKLAACVGAFRWPEREIFPLVPDP